MAGPTVDDGSTYSPRIAFIYVFNLILGTGVLALPSVLTSGGWVLGSLFLMLVAISSYIGVTFVIESMASANALLALTRPMEQMELLSVATNGPEDEEATPLVSAPSSSTATARDSPAKGSLFAKAGASSPTSAGRSGAALGSSSALHPASKLPAAAATAAASATATASSPSTPSGLTAVPTICVSRSQKAAFEIVQRTELGQMAELFFSETGRIFFYLALIFYLYGDATIYCTFIPRSLVGFLYGKDAPAWAFDVCLVGFVAVIVPFCFFDFQKTKFLQLFTMIIRNVALTAMIVLAIWLVHKQGSRTEGVPNFRVSKLPNLFGGAVYAFMCHHSLPGIITPMRDKSWVAFVLKSAFASVFTIYFLLFISCGIAFGLGAEDPITFNFLPAQFGLLGDFLFLFPVFTLSSNYPMLTITLRNNLDTLLHLVLPRGAAFLPPVAAFSPRPPKSPSLSLGQKEQLQLRNATRSRKLIVTFIAVAPPILGCIAAEHAGVDVSSLVGLTGAYAGAAVMLVIPACLVHCSRLVVNKEIPAAPASKGVGGGVGPHQANIHASPFSSPNWVIALIVFALLAAAFITFDELVGA